MAIIGDVLDSAAAIAKGMSITFKEMLSPAITEEYPDGPAQLRGAVSRSSTCFSAMRTALKNASPVSFAPPPAQPIASILKPPRTPRAADQRRRAIRQSLQHRLQPLHFLRLLRRGVPDRRDYAWAWIRACQLQHIHADLPQRTNAGSTA